jgi:hypothetical protein
MAQNLFTQAWAWYGLYTAKEHIAVDLGGMYWYAMIVLWLLLAATVYLSPYVL